jgi:hypothetical protein
MGRPGMGMTGEGASLHCGNARLTALGRTATDATATPLVAAAAWAAGTTSESSTLAVGGPEGD